MRVRECSCPPSVVVEWLCDELQQRGLPGSLYSRTLLSLLHPHYCTGTPHYTPPPSPPDTPLLLCSCRYITASAAAGVPAAEARRLLSNTAALQASRQSQVGLLEEQEELILGERLHPDADLPLLTLPQTPHKETYSGIQQCGCSAASRRARRRHKRQQQDCVDGGSGDTLHKLAALHCLLLADEEQERSDLESLLEELCFRLKTAASAEEARGRDTLIPPPPPPPPVKEPALKGTTVSLDGPASCQDIGDEAQRYFEAFPALRIEATCAVESSTSVPWCCDSVEHVAVTPSISCTDTSTGDQHLDWGVLDTAEATTTSDSNDPRVGGKEADSEHSEQDALNGGKVMLEKCIKSGFVDLHAKTASKFGGCGVTASAGAASTDGGSEGCTGALRQHHTKAGLKEDASSSCVIDGQSATRDTQVVTLHPCDEVSVTEQKTDIASIKHVAVHCITPLRSNLAVHHNTADKANNSTGLAISTSDMSNNSTDVESCLTIEKVVKSSEDTVCGVNISVTEAFPQHCSAAQQNDAVVSENQSNVVTFFNITQNVADDVINEEWETHSRDTCVQQANNGIGSVCGELSRQLPSVPGQYGCSVGLPQLAGASRLTEPVDAGDGDPHPCSVSQPALNIQCVTRNDTNMQNRQKNNNLNDVKDEKSASLNFTFTNENDYEQSMFKAKRHLNFFSNKDFKLSQYCSEDTSYLYGIGSHHSLVPPEVELTRGGMETTGQMPSIASTNGVTFHSECLDDKVVLVDGTNVEASAGYQQEVQKELPELDPYGLESCVTNLVCPKTEDGVTLAAAPAGVKSGNSAGVRLASPASVCCDTGVQPPLHPTFISSSSVAPQLVVPHGGGQFGIWGALGEEDAALDGFVRPGNTSSRESSEDRGDYDEALADDEDDGDSCRSYAATSRLKGYKSSAKCKEHHRSEGEPQQQVGGGVGRLSFMSLLMAQEKQQQQLEQRRIEELVFSDQRQRAPEEPHLPLHMQQQQRDAHDQQLLQEHLQRDSKLFDNVFTSNLHTFDAVCGAFALDHNVREKEVNVKVSMQETLAQYLRLLQQSDATNHSDVEQQHLINANSYSLSIDFDDPQSVSKSSLIGERGFPVSTSHSSKTSEASSGILCHHSRDVNIWADQNANSLASCLSSNAFPSACRTNVTEENQRPDEEQSLCKTFQSLGLERIWDVQGAADNEVDKARQQMLEEASLYKQVENFEKQQLRNKQQQFQSCCGTTLDTWAPMQQQNPHANLQQFDARLTATSSIVNPTFQRLSSGSSLTETNKCVTLPCNNISSSSHSIPSHEQQSPAPPSFFPHVDELTCGDHVSPCTGGPSGVQAVLQRSNQSNFSSVVPRRTNTQSSDYLKPSLSSDVLGSKEENLLTSPRTHFRPIKLGDDTTVARSSTTTSFTVATSGHIPLSLPYQRSSSGTLYLEKDSIDGSPKKYMIYKDPSLKPSDYRPVFMHDQESSLVPKFKVVENEKFCQTEDTLNTPVWSSTGMTPPDGFDDDSDVFAFQKLDLDSSNTSNMGNSSSGVVVPPRNRDDISDADSKHNTIFTCSVSWPYESSNRTAESKQPEQQQQYAEQVQMGYPSESLGARRRWCNTFESPTKSFQKTFAHGPPPTTQTAYIKDTSKSRFLDTPAARAIWSSDMNASLASMTQRHEAAIAAQHIDPAIKALWESEPGNTGLGVAVEHAEDLSNKALPAWTMNCRGDNSTIEKQIPSDWAEEKSIQYADDNETAPVAAGFAIVGGDIKSGNRAGLPEHMSWRDDPGDTDWSYRQNYSTIASSKQNTDLPHEWSDSDLANTWMSDVRKWSTGGGDAAPWSTGDEGHWSINTIDRRLDDKNRDFRWTADDVSGVRWSHGEQGEREDVWWKGEGMTEDVSSSNLDLHLADLALLAEAQQWEKVVSMGADDCSAVSVSQQNIQQYEEGERLLQQEDLEELAPGWQFSEGFVWDPQHGTTPRKQGDQLNAGGAEDADDSSSTCSSTADSSCSSSSEVVLMHTEDGGTLAVQVEYLDEELYDRIFGAPDLNMAGSLPDLPNNQAGLKVLRERWLPPWRRPCTFFMEGSCRRKHCKFSHDLSTITCRFWQDGSCLKGSECPFLHGYPVVTRRRNRSEGDSTRPPESLRVGDDQRGELRKEGAGRQGRHRLSSFEITSETDFPSLGATSENKESGLQCSVTGSSSSNALVSSSSAGGAITSYQSQSNVAVAHTGPAARRKTKFIPIPASLLQSEGAATTSTARGRRRRHTHSVHRSRTPDARPRTGAAAAITSGGSSGPCADQSRGAAATASGGTGARAKLRRKRSKASGGVGEAVQGSEGERHVHRDGTVSDY